MTKKCKCKKDVIVVVIDSSTPYGGTFCDFLKELSPEKRCKYTYVPFYANTSTEAWVDKLKCKLQQLCKKNCKKPCVLSTLFDTNLEMLLARVQACVNCFFLTHSTSEVNSIFKCFRTLPAGKLKERTNEYYTNQGRFSAILLDSEEKISYIDSVVRNLADTSVTTTDNCGPLNRGLFILTNKNPPIVCGVPYGELQYAAKLSDNALYQHAVVNGGSVDLEKIDENYYIRIDNPEHRLYYNIYRNMEYTPEENLGIMMNYAGLVKSEDNPDRYNLNQTSSAALAYNWCYTCSSMI